MTMQKDQYDWKNCFIYKESAADDHCSCANKTGHVLFDCTLITFCICAASDRVTPTPSSHFMITHSTNKIPPPTGVSRGHDACPRSGHQSYCKGQWLMTTGQRGLTTPAPQGVGANYETQAAHRSHYSSWILSVRRGAIHRLLISVCYRRSSLWNRYFDQATC